MDGDRQGVKRSSDSIDLYDGALCCMVCLVVSLTVCEGYGEERVPSCSWLSFVQRQMA